MSDFTEEELKELLNKDSQSLATMIVINRTLGSYKKESKFCMIELMKRRSLGEDFQFENFIKENTQSHKINFNIPNVKSIKQEFVSSIIKEVIKGNLFSSSPEENNENDIDDLEDDD